VSFYKIVENIVQEYTKSSYCQEDDTAIFDGEYAYLFGQGMDSTGQFNMVSTQICYDLSCGARALQKTGTLAIKAPIHIIQSNRLEISGFLSPDQLNIPGHPKVVIHADPSWQEVFVPYTASNMDLPTESLTSSSSSSSSSPSTAAPVVREHYATIAPKQTFTFSIDKGGYKDSYTITHWILNEHLSAMYGKI
jgi:hypothetical protein